MVTVDEARAALVASNDELREKLHARTAILAGFVFATLWFLLSYAIAKRELNDLTQVALAFGCASYHPTKGTIQYHTSDEAPQREE